MPAPKRPLTGYFLFMAEIRSEVESQSGKKGIKNAAIFSKRWKGLNEKDKSKYMVPAQKAYGKYRVQLVAYKKTSQYADDMKAKQAKKLKKMKAPKDRNGKLSKFGMRLDFVFSKQTKATHVSIFPIHASKTHNSRSEDPHSLIRILSKCG